MSAIHVRPATPDDLTAITAIYRPAVLTGTASFETEPPDETEMRRRYQDITGKGYPYLVAEIGGRVVGYAYASAYRTRPAYKWSVENSIYVAPEAQKRGIGHALLPVLIERSTALGYRQMIAVIGDSANFGSIRLHRAHGFIFSGVIHSVGYKLGRWLDSVIMQRALGPGDGTPPTR